MKIALVGASGYAAYYLSLYEEYINEREYPICAVIDPFAARSEYAGWIKERRIPIYDTLDDFYNHDEAALVMIVSPIAFHRGQAITAMEHASAVLCEKPLTATLDDAMALRSVWLKTKVPFGVGFQWSFSKTMQSLKNDIMSGRLGKPLCLRTHTSWKRPDSYYDPNGWKGRLKDHAGRWVMDSIAMNATAHFLHNLFFIMGDAMDTAMAPDWIEGSVYRGRAIESYDTIFLRGAFKNGCRMTYTASHVGEINSNPKFTYEFENAVVTFGHHEGPDVVARFSDGSEKIYGAPQSRHEDINKMTAMIEAARNRTQPVCTIDTAMPHLRVCMAVADKMPVTNFPETLVVRETDPPGLHVKGLGAAMDAFYESGRLPAEQGCAWAGRDIRVNMADMMAE